MIEMLTAAAVAPPEPDAADDEDEEDPQATRARDMRAATGTAALSTSLRI
jgi:hypothetical protein